MTNSEQLLPQQEASLNEKQKEDFLRAWELAILANDYYNKMRASTEYATKRDYQGFLMTDVSISEFKKNKSRFDDLQGMTNVFMPPRSVFEKPSTKYSEDKYFI